MKNKHYEMIVAKAANMELVVFAENINTGEWWECSLGFPFNSQQRFFLCLPKHKDAVLEKLNGGECQFLPPIDGYREWNSPENHQFERWSYDWWYMDDKFESRIKPKKEKRWIGCYPSSKVTPISFSSIEEVKNYVSKNSLYTHCAPEAWQFIEIEVEV